MEVIQVMQVRSSKVSSCAGADKDGLRREGDGAGGVHRHGFFKDGSRHSKSAISVQHCAHLYSLASAYQMLVRAPSNMARLSHMPRGVSRMKNSCQAPSNNQQAAQL